MLIDIKIRLRVKSVSVSPIFQIFEKFKHFLFFKIKLFELFDEMRAAFQKIQTSEQSKGVRCAFAVNHMGISSLCVE